MTRKEKLTKKEKKILLIRTIIIFLTICLITYLTIKALPFISKLATEESRLELKDDIANMGIKGVIITLGLQILQIVVAVIPGQPMEIISGMLYGTLGGMLLCLVGIFIGTFIVFYLTRKIGISFIQLFFDQEQIDKFKNKKLFKNPKKLELFMFIMFVIPLIPKDIFIYLAGISPVNPKRFLIIATISRIPGLFITVYAGNRLSEGNFIIAILLVALFIALGIIGYKISSRAEEKIENDIKN
ncbi:MAG: VTT domain-containing protein [Clostridia bacterium]|nr:VTT domain-containing protein [Clostridia bacterium]